MCILKYTPLPAQGCDLFQCSGCTVDVILVCGTLGTQTHEREREREHLEGTDAHLDGFVFVLLQKQHAD